MNETLTHQTLTPEDHAFFLEHGYLIIKNVVPADVISEAVAFLEEGGFEGEVGGPNYQPRLSESVSACVTEKVHNALAELLGPDYDLPRKTGAVDFPRPYTPEKPWTSQRFHLDSDYPTRMPTEDILSHFIFLTTVRSHGGAFQYAPGSPQRYFAVMGDNPEALALKTAQPELSGTIHEYLAEPGDMLVMTHLGGHAGSNNVTDPQTRHALLDRYDTAKRLVPGLKPFEEMSSVEKVYSARYLREQKGMDIPMPALALDARTDTALREGVVIASDLVSCVTFLDKANPGLLFVTASAPDQVQWAISPDFVGWETATALELPGAAITSLHDYKRDGMVSVFLGGKSPQQETWLMTGPDAFHLTTAETLPDAAFAFGHYTTDFGSSVARGRVVYIRPADQPNRILCQWGKTWQEAVSNSQGSEVAASPEGSTIAEALIAPSNAGPPFALIADVQIGGSETTLLHYSISRDVAKFEDALQPLPFDAETAPRCLRVFARARSYWLVTYLRPVKREIRLFWGVVDWEKIPVQLTEIHTAAAMQEAHCIVGWI